MEIVGGLYMSSKELWSYYGGFWLIGICLLLALNAVLDVLMMVKRAKHVRFKASFLMFFTMYAGLTSADILYGHTGWGAFTHNIPYSFGASLFMYFVVVGNLTEVIEYTRKK